MGSVDKEEKNPKLWKKVKKVLAHPDYVGQKFGADMCLLELEQDVEFNSNVRPICLNSKFKKHYDSLIASGWSKTKGTFSFITQTQWTGTVLKKPINIRDHNKEKFHKTRSNHDTWILSSYISMKLSMKTAVHLWITMTKLSIKWVFVQHTWPKV